MVAKRAGGQLYIIDGHQHADVLRIAVLPEKIILMKCAYAP